MGQQWWAFAHQVRHDQDPIAGIDEQKGVDGHVKRYQYILPCENHRKPNDQKLYAARRTGRIFDLYLR